MFIKTAFESSVSLAYVLFVTTSTVYHVDEDFGVTVDIIRDSSSFPSSRKRVVGVEKKCLLLASVSSETLPSH